LSTPKPSPATIKKNGWGGCVVRLKDDGSLDLDWREARRPWWTKTPEEREAELMVELLQVIRHKHPELTPEEAQEMLDSII
jgi:hypothetical protein